jgi:hypothetical protein
VRTVDISPVQALLPALEMALPYPVQYKRDLSAHAPLMNARVNHALYASGALGPIKMIAAYCLPNYDEMRSSIGSKQVMYPSNDGLTLPGKEIRRLLNNSPAALAWAAEHDPELRLAGDIWDAQVILHETIGHGSGKYALHVGDEVPVTSENVATYIKEYSALEEILALYVSVFHLPEIQEVGLLAKWKHLPREELEIRLIEAMLDTGLRRHTQQRQGATQISGAHALANNTWYVGEVPP